MAVKLQTLLDRSIRNMGDGMDVVVKESALELIRQAYSEGIYVQITSGFRSFEEQDRLFSQGRTDMSKPIVTNAQGGEFNHNYGLAVDFVIMSEDGSRALWTVNDQWNRAAEIAKSLGFSWGGDWTSFKDYPHLEMMGGLTLKDLQAGKRPNLTAFKGVQTEAPKWNGVPLKEGQIGRIEILKPINLWKRDKNKKLTTVRVLKPGESYRVYGYDDLYFGQYNVGEGLWVTNIPGYIKYTTPTKSTLEKARKYYEE